MTTIVNSPTPSDTGGNSMGVVVAVVVLVVLLAFLFWGLPAWRGAPSNNGGTDTGNQPTINVPDKVDVNVNKTP